MTIKFHPHAIQRMQERGATRAEAIETVKSGSGKPAKFNRTKFSKVFAFNSVWNSKRYRRKQVDAFAAKMPYGWFVITVIVKYF